jgi:hypothetical protein
MGRSSYPGQLDSDVEIPRVDDNITEIGGEAINSLRDAIFSIEDAIGINPQGNVEDFVTRVNRVIDENGNIKLSALSARGLVTLPISNDQIDANAGIEETKLALDYTTAALYADIISSRADSESIRQGLNSITSRTIKHFLGTSDNHDGYMVSLIAPVMAKEDVESALHTVSNYTSDHVGNLNISAHMAKNISVSNEFVNITANNVQDAIENLDVVFNGLIETHQDDLHANGIGINIRGVQDEQGNTVESTLASTIFQTEISKSTNILQVMRPNVARVSSKNINLRSLSVSSAFVLRILAGGVERSWLDINLTSIIPVDSLDEVVTLINSTAHTSANHYPISAYNINGQLTIAHNIPGEEFTIQILNTVSYSAATALGFGDIISTTFSWSNEHHAAYVGGKRINDIKSLIKLHYVHSQAQEDKIVLGIGNLADYGISVGNEGRLICNITNHSLNPDDNGSHYIISYLDNETFMLSSEISNGEFDIEIAADCVNFQNTTNGEIYNILLENDGDGYGIVTKQLHASYGPISGINMAAISAGFPTNSVSWEVTGSEYVRLYEDGVAGAIATIPVGYIGQIEVFAPDNINKAILEVTGGPANLQRSISAVQFIESDDKLLLSSVHYGGNFGLYTLKFVNDKRQIGAVHEKKSEDILIPDKLEDSLNEIHNNGIFRGFDVISYASSSILVRGGKALVNGKMLDVVTQNISVVDFTEGTKLLVLDRFGNYSIKGDLDAGYSFEELTIDDSYGDNRGVATILEFETTGSAVSGVFYDRRFLIGNIDKRLLNTENEINNKITQLQNTMLGSMWGVAIFDHSVSMASIGVDFNTDAIYVPSMVGWWDQNSTDAIGFLDGQANITTRRFEMQDTLDNILSSGNDFVSPGSSHINVAIGVEYTGLSGATTVPFAVSGEVGIEIGVAARNGITTVVVHEDYARVRTIYEGSLPSSEVKERYVVSIPISRLGLEANSLADFSIRTKIVNSNHVDGQGYSNPILNFDNARIIISSYSIAGYINGEDGSDVSISAVVSETL